MGKESQGVRESRERREEGKGVGRGRGGGGRGRGGGGRGRGGGGREER